MQKALFSNALTVWRRNLRFLALVITTIAVVLLGHLSNSAQLSAEQLKSLSDKDFEICLSHYLYTDGPNGGSKSLLITIFVPPKVATRAKITAFHQRIKGTTSTEENVMAFFLVDRDLAENPLRPGSESDDVYMKAVRGLYLRKASAGKEIFKYFPSGVSEADLDGLTVSGKLKD